MRTTSQGKANRGASGSGTKTPRPSTVRTSDMVKNDIRVVLVEAMTLWLKGFAEQYAGTFRAEQAVATAQRGVLQFRRG